MQGLVKPGWPVPNRGGRAAPAGIGAVGVVARGAAARVCPVCVPWKGPCKNSSSSSAAAAADDDDNAKIMVVVCYVLLLEGGLAEPLGGDGADERAEERKTCCWRLRTQEVWSDVWLHKSELCGSCGSYQKSGTGSR